MLRDSEVGYADFRNRDKGTKRMKHARHIAVLIALLICSAPGVSHPQSTPPISAQETELLRLLRVDDEAEQYAANRRAFVLMDENVARRFLLTRCQGKSYRFVERLKDSVYLDVVESGLASYLNANANKIETLRNSPSPGLGAIFAFRKLSKKEQADWLAALRLPETQRAIKFKVRLDTVATVVQNWAVDVRSGKPYSIAPIWLGAYLKRAQLDALFLAALTKTNPPLASRLRVAFREGDRTGAPNEPGARNMAILSELEEVFPELVQELIQSLAEPERANVMSLLARAEMIALDESMDAVDAVRYASPMRLFADVEASRQCKDEKSAQAIETCKLQVKSGGRPLSEVEKFVVAHDQPFRDFAQTVDMTEFASKAIIGKCAALKDTPAPGMK
jgi:hypothetical protein